MPKKPIDPKTGFIVGYHGSALQAIDWALDHEHKQGDTADVFLRQWRLGDLDEWPEYYDWLREQENVG